jgi:hypothetical protein
MKIKDYRPMAKGTLTAFLTLEVPKWGVEIRDCAYHVKGDQRWVSLPSKQFELNGEKKYAPYIKFATEELRDAFTRKALEAIDAHLAVPGVEAEEELPF